MQKRSFSLILFIILILTACTPVQPGAPATQPPTAPALDGTKWDFGGFSTPDSLTPPVADTGITLDFTGDQVGGSAGCNGYGGSYKLDGNNLTFSSEGFMRTMMFCDPQEVMDQEDKFLSWLAGAQTVALDGDHLTIHTSEGDLIFTKAQNATLEGSNWQLSSIVDENGATGTAVDQNIYIKFANGGAAGSSGCNTFTADYKLEGEKMTLTITGATRKACQEEEGKREEQFMTALQKVAGYNIERSTLSLLDTEGNLLMSFSSGQ
ncbi:MAG: META domain-containing protein [Anaerolineales bacterium]|nr:META domain-containing protein [Anaerolineales bacterium]